MTSENTGATAPTTSEENGTAESLENFGIEADDPLHSELDDLQAEVNEIDDRFVEVSGVEVKRRLADVKATLESAKEARLDEIEVRSS